MFTSSMYRQWYACVLFKCTSSTVTVHVVVMVHVCLVCWCALVFGQYLHAFPMAWIDLVLLIYSYVVPITKCVSHL